MAIILETSRSYQRAHLRGLNRMRQKDQLCDVTIQVEGRKFRAHKAVLAATGDYFLSMFTSGFKEGSAQEITVEGSAVAFEILLSYAYTSMIFGYQLAPCMYEVLEMACYMQFTEFAQTCAETICKLLEQEVDETILSPDVSVTDVCKVIVLAQQHKYLASLYKATLSFFAEKVQSVKSFNIFLKNADATYLQDLLCQENLSNAEEELHVLELVINWLKHDWEKRKGHSHQLLQKVRLGLVAPDDIKTLIGPEILDAPGCSELVNHVLDLKASTDKDVLVAENPDIAATRSTITLPVMNHKGKMEYFDAEVRRADWYHLEKFAPLPCTQMDAMVVANGILYIAGGPNRKKFYMYQAGANKWLQLPSKPLHRKELRLVSVDAYIYAFGTCTTLNNPVIERYDINGKKWEVLRKDQEGVQGNSDANTTNYMLVAEVMDAAGNDGKCNCTRSHRLWRDQYISAVVFKEKIFASSLRCVRSRRETTYRQMEELMIFDPQTNACQITAKLTERTGDRNDNWFEPTLFTHKDELYHAITEMGSVEHGPVWVTRLSVTREEDGRMKVEEGESCSSVDNHDKMPDDVDDNQFYLQGKIFASERPSMCTSWYLMDSPIYLKPSDLNCYPAYMCTSSNSKPNPRCCSNPVWFSFDKKKLTDKSSHCDEDSDY